MSKTLTLTATCEAGGMFGLCATPPGGIHNFGPVTVSGTDFALGMNACNSGVLLTITFPSSNDCASTVVFTPTSGGAKTGTLTAPPAPSVILSGTGIAPLASPTSPTLVQTSKKCKKRKKKGAGTARKCKRKKK